VGALAIPRLEPVYAAEAAGLRYVSDARPGIRRVRSGPKSFRYLDPRGRVVRDEATLGRIRAIVIPPAWTEVWICQDPDGHIQATGRDARGRKQYRYHPRWRETRDEHKFARMAHFARLLPRIRARLEADLGRPGLPREKALAAVVRLMEATMIRVGGAEYARDNDSYGLCTLRNDHVDVRGAKIRFRFRGKSGREHEVGIEDARLARIVRRCQELPGQELFCWLDGDGRAVDIGSADVNAYLKKISGEEVTAKDFRTWGGTVAALRALDEIGACTSAATTKRAVVDCIKRVSEILGNTPTVSRKFYVHPAVLEAYQTGSLFDAQQHSPRGPRGLSRDERRVVALLDAHTHDGHLRAVAKAA
jgi:DNA topoisomerase-1